ncbi:heterogeneous nuclear ribonucleoprotein U-like protein 1 isoform X1 [Bolinopsis microptera]|uniref:heterogeneous nuclear ribonucleoprotein U-like protein 1 isoform X1 n=1 Tax=Bolinopsis microptera TaxID=2820187 RepID=UPI00307A4207
MNPVLLDDNNADLNFNIRADGLAGHSLSHNGWQYMWAGVRSTHGVLRGKVFFEVHVINHYKLNEYLEGCDVKADCNIRVGWSHDQTNLLLGEDVNSYGYDGAGFKSLDGKFDVYGGRLHLHDVITCYLDLDCGLVSFQKNDEFLGTAFKLDKRAKESPFLPHICVKNTEVFVNFGQKPPAFKPPHGFIFISHTHPNNLVATLRPPNKPTDLELIMMIGLPGAGKTTYALKQMSEKPEKRYYLLGQDMIMGHLRNAAVKRYKLKWNRVVKLCSDIATEQLKLAGTKSRNYIVDQTNVYAAPRRQKLRIFENYKAIAAVLVVTDTELIKRCKEREQVSPKHIPLPAVDEMKKNFTLPHEDEGLFSEIRYVEQNRTIAEAIMSSYKTSREMNNKPGILRAEGGVSLPGLGFRPSYQLHPGARHLPPGFIQQPPRYPMRRNEYKQPDMFNGKRDDNIDHLAKSVDNIRLKEPDQAEIMRKVNRAPYKKHPVEEQEKVAPAENKDVKDDKPEQIVHPIQSKPEQIVHPIQNMHYVKEQIQPPPPPQIMATQDTFSHMYMPRMNDKDNNSRPGIIPMSKINDHTMFGSHHLTTSHPGYLTNTGNARYSAGNTGQQQHRPLPMNMANLQFQTRSQTPVSSNYNSLASLSTPNFNQNTLSSNFGSSQPGPFISQGLQGHMTNQEQLLAFQLLQQNTPFQQMMMPQNYQMPGLELMPQALHSTSGLHSTPLLQQSNIPDHFATLSGSHGLRYPAGYNLQKPKQFGR